MGKPVVPRHWLQRSIRWTLALLWCGLVFCFSSRFSLPLLPRSGALSYLLHFGAYALLAALLSWALRPAENPSSSSPWSLVFAFAITAAVAVLHEFYQHMVAGRRASVVDLLADLAGITCALMVVGWSRRQQR